MVFSTQSFLFFFLPLFLGIYFLLPAGSCNRLRNYWLLAGSLVFMDGTSGNSCLCFR
jgi:hypothetical protein